jgi:hypothetical protein
MLLAAESAGAARPLMAMTLIRMQEGFCPAILFSQLKIQLDRGTRRIGDKNLQLPGLPGFKLAVGNGVLLEALSRALEVVAAQGHVIKMTGPGTAAARIFNKVNNGVTAGVQPVSADAELRPETRLQAKHFAVELHDLIQDFHRSGEAVMVYVYAVLCHFPAL